MLHRWPVNRHLGCGRRQNSENAQSSPGACASRVCVGFPRAPDYSPWTCDARALAPKPIHRFAMERTEEMALEIATLGDEHLENAAALVVTRYHMEREQVPSLPARYEDADQVLPLLRDLVGRAPGVAAVRDGQLAGFLIGLVLPSWRGRRSLYVPEWAHSANPEDCREVYQIMYAHLSPRWLANGCFTHLITLFAHDRESINTWFWLGFGLAAVDAMRDLGPVQGPAVRVDIRRATLEDLDLVTSLAEDVQRHLAAPPIFLALAEKGNRESHEKWLLVPANSLWLAFQGGEPVGYVRLEPSNPSAAFVIRDEKTISVTGAFTKERLRRRGVGTALLRQSLDWARSEGYERCAVSFEPQNVSGARFWLKHFQAICFSLVRDVDERIAWAHELRADKDFW